MVVLLWKLRAAFLDTFDLQVQIYAIVVLLLTYRTAYLDTCDLQIQTYSLIYRRVVVPMSNNCD